MLRGWPLLRLLRIIIVQPKMTPEITTEMNMTTQSTFIAPPQPKIYNCIYMVPHCKFGAHTRTAKQRIKTATIAPRVRDTVE
jgi:hypothetical protein